MGTWGISREYHKKLFGPVLYEVEFSLNLLQSGTNERGSGKAVRTYAT